MTVTYDENTKNFTVGNFILTGDNTFSFKSVED